MSNPSEHNRIKDLNIIDGYNVLDSHISFYVDGIVLLLFINGTILFYLLNDDFTSAVKVNHVYFSDKYKGDNLFYMSVKTDLDKENYEYIQFVYKIFFGI